MAGWFVRDIVNSEKRHIYVTAFVVVMVIVALFMLSVFSVRVCYDEACFMAQANVCGHAVFTNEIASTTVFYEVKDCTLNKTITAMDPLEPESVREDFVGKSMKCLYIRNDFSPLFLERISFGIDTGQCIGELRDIILLYQYY